MRVSFHGRFEMRQFSTIFWDETVFNDILKRDTLCKSHWNKVFSANKKTHKTIKIAIYVSVILRKKQFEKQKNLMWYIVRLSAIKNAHIKSCL